MATPPPLSTASINQFREVTKMIFDHFHDGKSKFLDIRLEISATAAVVTTATVVIAISIAISSGIRIASDVSGHGAGLDLVNQILVLLGLRSCQTQGLVLGSQTCDLVLGHVINDAVADLINGRQRSTILRCRNHRKSA